MTYEELYKNITDGEYNTKLPFPPYRSDNKERVKMQESDREMKRLWREDDNKLLIRFKLDLQDYIESELGVSVNKDQWQAIWHKVWEDGHSSGYNEILNVASELLDILISFVGSK